MQRKCNLIFPKLRFEGEQLFRSCAENTPIHECAKVNVYSLDWSAQVFAGNKLPGIWDTKITELQFMLSPQYLKEIYDNVDQASLE